MALRSLFTSFPLLLLYIYGAAAAPTISFTPSTLKRSGDSVTVQRTGVDSPSELDWLGIYSPPNSRHHHFIGYFFLSSSATWKSGAGNLSFPLINLRSPYQIRIFRWTDKEIDPSKMDHDKNPLPRTKHLLASSGELRFENPGGPEQIHLAFTDRTDEMRVSFVAGDGGKKFVKYGKDEEELTEAAETTVARLGVIQEVGVRPTALCQEMRIPMKPLHFYLETWELQRPTKHSSVPRMKVHRLSSGSFVIWKL